MNRTMRTTFVLEKVAGKTGQPSKVTFKQRQRLVDKAVPCKGRFVGASAAVESRPSELDSLSDTKTAKDKEKLCTRCKQVKPVRKFAKHGRSLDGRTRFCRACTLEEALLRPDDELDVTERTCRVCGELKPIQEFTRNAATVSGRDRKCRSCTKKIQQEAAQRNKALMEQNGGPMAKEKTCPKCLELKPANEFYRSNASSLGLSSRCRACLRPQKEGTGKLKYHTHVDLTEKHCNKCDRTLPVEAFGINRSLRSGLAAYCKQCYSRLQKERAEANKAYHRAALKAIS